MRSLVLEPVKVSFFLVLIANEYLKGENPSRFLLARYMYFYNNIRIEEGSTPQKKWRKIESMKEEK